MPKAQCFLVILPPFTIIICGLEVYLDPRYLEWQAATRLSPNLCSVSAPRWLNGGYGGGGEPHHEIGNIWLLFSLYGLGLRK